MHFKKYFLCPVLYGLPLLPYAQSGRVALPAADHQVVVIAHRGNHEHVPENTVAAIEQAISAGADYAEIDLRTTSDGFLVLQHDGSVDRMTNGKGMIRELTLDSIRRLRIIDKNTGLQYQVPEFKEILLACRNRINIYLDFKDADVEETYRQIKEAGMEKNVVVYLNQEGQYDQWRSVAPAIPLMTSLPDSVTGGQKLIDFFSHRSVQVLDNVYDPGLIKLLNQRHVAIWLDVESEEESPQIWNKALRLNIQGLQTDHPEELIAYLREQGKLKK